MVSAAVDSFSMRLQHLLSHNAVQCAVLVIMILRAYVLMLGLLDVPGTGVVAESSLYWCMDMFVLMYFPAVLLTTAATDGSHSGSHKIGHRTRSPLSELQMRMNGSHHADTHADNPGESESQENATSNENPRRVAALPVSALPVSAAAPAVPPKGSSPVQDGYVNSVTHSLKSSQSTPLCTPMSTPRPVENIEGLSTPRGGIHAIKHPDNNGNALGLVLSRWMKQSLVAAFGRWDQFTTERQKMKFVAGKVVKRWLQQSLWTGFDKWRTFAYTSKKLKKAGNAVVRRWGHAGLRQFFNPWAVQMQANWHLRCMETKIRKWCRLHVLWAAFITWRDAKFSEDDGVLDNVFFQLATDLDNGLTGLRTFFEGSPRKKQRMRDAVAGTPGPLEEDANFVML